MNKQLSIYLDLLRFLAAFLVFASHASGFTGGLLWQISGWGHEAVVIFFVLSGFVIAYVCFDKKEDVLKYAENRFARIYSVALPAVLLTIFLYYVGKEINGDVYTDLDKRLLNPFWTIISALSFLNQSWTGTTFFTNLPYWSLGYEVLYYIIFGIFIFTQGIKRVVLVGVSMIVMGPSILLYFPIWLMGVLCLKLVKQYSISLSKAVILYVISIAGIIFLSQTVVQEMLKLFFVSLFGNNFFNMLLEPADQFGSDYMLGFFFSLHIVSSAYIGKKYNIFSEQVGKKIRFLSSHTFSLYLYHMPILFFVATILPSNKYPIANFLICWMLVPIIIIFISNFTESKKNYYKRVVRHFFVRNTLSLI
ncbi:MAG: hypothetical protein COA81_06825 [Alphaproteobacteria bacterium]|nr:MAG: hypothetical protein COA81_06825 [Alphaproteobacteria bacterium]